MDEDVRGARPDRGHKRVGVLTIGATAQSIVHDRYRRPPRGTEPILAEILAEVAGFEQVPSS